MAELNIISVGFLVVYVLQIILSVWLERLNVRHLKQEAHTIPESLQGFIDPDKLASINAYTADNSRLFLIRKLFMDLAILALVVSGILWTVDRSVPGLEWNYILRGICFFTVVGGGLFVLGLPFDYYQTFVIEENYGFNRSDVKTWALDHAKSVLVSLVLLVLLLTPVFWTIRTFPDSWWIWGFAIVSVIQLILVVLYPMVIAPLFNTFTPLENQDLARETEALAVKAGMGTSGVYQMDAGRRSTHSNAYLTGLGKTKRIVLFDTLLASNTPDEILAVLAHEIGHWKLRHILKLYLFSQVVMLGGFFLTYHMMNWDLMYRTFGITTAQPYAALFIIGLFWSKIGYFTAPLQLGISRRFEAEADRFAVALQQTAEPLCLALKKLAGHNLSNVNPHPLYVRFRYSHPPIPQRLSLLEQLADAREAESSIHGNEPHAQAEIMNPDS